MKYRLERSKKFEKQLEKLDNAMATRILKYLYENVDNTENPRITGKPLKGNKKGIWRYRVGDYRILCDIQDKKLVILALELGNRKEIYKK